jgi:hypothetical protein
MTRSKTQALPAPASGLGWLRDPTRPSPKWGMAATVSLSGFLVSMSQMAVQVALMQNGLGNTLGLALMTTVLQNRLTYHSSLLDQQQAFSPLSWGDMLAPVRALVWQTGAVGGHAGAGAAASTSGATSRGGFLSGLFYARDTPGSCQHAAGVIAAQTRNVSSGRAVASAMRVCQIAVRGSSWALCLRPFPYLHQCRLCLRQP